jgi:hypothetical protein
MRPALNFLAGGGELGKLIRSLDWSKTRSALPKRGRKACA